MNADVERFDFEGLVGTIQCAHDELNAQAGRAVNLSLTLRNWLIGFYIAEYELNGADRANYGGKLLVELAKRTTHLANCNRRQLYDYLKFYRVYPQIAQCRHNCYLLFQSLLQAVLKKCLQCRHN